MPVLGRLRLHASPISPHQSGSIRYASVRSGMPMPNRLHLCASPACAHQSGLPPSGPACRCPVDSASMLVWHDRASPGTSIGLEMPMRLAMSSLPGFTTHLRHAQYGSCIARKRHVGLFWLLPHCPACSEDGLGIFGFTHLYHWEQCLKATSQPALLHPGMPIPAHLAHLGVAPLQQSRSSSVLPDVC